MKVPWLKETFLEIDKLKTSEVVKNTIRNLKYLVLQKIQRIFQYSKNLATFHNLF